MEIAALKLAASIVSPIFTKLGDKAAPYFGGDITDGEVQHLQNIILPKFRTVLRMAEAVPVYELKPWLRTLQDAAYEAEDVLDTYEYKRLEAEASSLSDPLKKLKKRAKDLIASSSLKTDLKKCMEKLQQSADEADKLISLYGAISQTSLLQDTTKQQQQPPTVSSPSSPIFGRDEECESLVDMLISTTNENSSSEKRTPILAIYGLGGAGKTTLAQRLYNDSRVVEHFDTRMWVHVSRKFDAHKVTSEIIESATKGEGSNNIRSLDILQTRLKDILKSKTFLLVLDDVWCQDSMQWDQMLIPLNEFGDSRSKILVTTRTQEVALRLQIENVFPLKDLEAEDCLSIFKYYSFSDANKVIQDPELATVVEQIMKKLLKSPLSARMIGSLLGGKKNIADWKRILKKDEILKDTLNALYLSFDNLAPHLQRCFAVCSLYPKGYHFDLMEVDALLLRLWIAQGFVEAPCNNNMTIEDMGMQYFNELVSHSFFQENAYKYGGVFYVIHDLLHDLAEDVSKGHCFRIEDDSEHIPTTVRHLSIWTTDQSLHIPRTFKLINLRTFMINHYISQATYDSIFDGRNIMFEKFKKLRVLHLGYNRLSELHKTIGQLKHLRSLQANPVKRLPESLCRLYHLQFLNFHRCNLIEGVPENLNNLVNLRFLHADYEIISKIPLFGKLASLQNIERYNASRKKGHGIEQLKNLRQLRGSLHINNLENVRNRAEASEASLKEKKLLDKLTLSWTCSPERDGRIDEEVIKGLEPPSNLNVLSIDGYNGIGFPEWLVNDGCFSIPHFLHLSELSIEICPKLERVPSLPSTLKLLDVRRCENLNEMPSLPSCLRVVRVKNCPKVMQLSPFPPNLEELEIKTCPGVETLLSNILLFEGDDEHPNHEQQEKEHFPLKTMSIRRCSVSGKKRLFSDPNKLFTSLSKLCLRELPWLTSLFHLDHKLTSLEDIIIEDCENLELFGSSLASSSSLRHVHIYNCPELACTWNLHPFSSLKYLHVVRCRKLTIGAVERPPPFLKRLTVDDLSLLTALLPRRGLLNSLKELTMKTCTQGIAFTEESFQGLNSLTDLCIEDCPNVTSLPANMEDLPSLRRLYIRSCPKIELLPDLPASLEKLFIQECHPQLEVNYKKDGPLRHKLQHITDVAIYC